MSRMPVIALVVLSVFGTAAPALAQVLMNADAAGAVPRSGGVNPGGIDDLTLCQTSAGASRVRRNNDCGLENQPLELTEILVPRSEPFAPAVPQCEATTLIEYSQRAAVARVAGTVSVASCEVGTAGKFTLVARVRDEAGETMLIEFTETWQRADVNDIAFEGDYPIGDDVELVNVRVRNLTCTCAESPASPPEIRGTPGSL